MGNVYKSDQKIPIVVFHVDIRLQGPKVLNIQREEEKLYCCWTIVASHVQSVGTK